ncbi:MAG: GNAT family N-acetyltransferase [Rhodospirillaceae bacterium]|jgi:GNAT superfamily N-acetyltransferase|nr:GNAT family N-acetyltransferase [Rhodospirillaceae bacterium]MBT6116914.1 GNAT family N-acetyltransferase [Rhodospirillaceae bacterium]
MEPKIVPLTDASGAMAVELAHRYEAEWFPYYGPEGPGDAAADMATYRSDDGLPRCLVALDAASHFLGTAALKSDSLGAEIAPGPWLAALLVAPERRGQGVGRALVAAVEAEARRLGYSALYASTDSARSILIRRGWARIGETGSLRGPIEVFRIGLDGS